MRSHMRSHMCEVVHEVARAMKDLSARRRKNSATSRAALSIIIAGKQWGCFLHVTGRVSVAAS
jgi:hypothetical protein